MSDLIPWRQHLTYSWETSVSLLFFFCSCAQPERRFPPPHSLSVLVSHDYLSILICREYLSRFIVRNTKFIEWAPQKKKRILKLTTVVLHASICLSRTNNFHSQIYNFSAHLNNYAWKLVITFNSHIVASCFRYKCSARKLFKTLNQI